MQDFLSMGLPQPLLRSLEQMQFVTPTPIQAQAIPPALEGRDILGSAQTGTGKTAAFSIPMIVKLLANPRSHALVMTPTRELATQVLDMIQKLLGKNSSIKTALLIGGDSMQKQLQQLRMRPRIIAGTPGRINDHLTRGTLMLNETDFLVLDETDRMLDMGFGVQLERIAKYLTAKRQTLLFSATLPNDIIKLSQKYVKDPVRVAVGSTSTPIAKIKQELIHTTEAEKYAHLVTQLDQRQGSILVFVKTKWGAEKLTGKLDKDEHSVDTIHGDLRQNKRDRVIHAFRNQKNRILVATDIAARGLDIPHIEHVINYDLPQSPEDYIHRIGRTARAGAEGSAVCLITPQDGAKWKAIHRLINPNEKMAPTPKSGSKSGSKFGAGAGFARKRGGERPAEGSRSSGFRARSPRLEENIAGEERRGGTGTRFRGEGARSNSEGFRPRREEGDVGERRRRQPSASFESKTERSGDFPSRYARQKPSRFSGERAEAGQPSESRRTPFVKRARPDNDAGKPIGRKSFGPSSEAGQPRSFGARKPRSSGEDAFRTRRAPTDRKFARVNER